MATYTTYEGDMMDAIAFRVYGETPGMTEAVFNANQQLGRFGPQLPAGVVIELPEIVETPEPTATVNLWD